VKNGWLGSQVNIVHKEIIGGGGNQTKSNLTEELLPIVQPNPDSPHRIVAKKRPPQPKDEVVEKQVKDDAEVKPSFVNMRKLEMLAMEPKIVAVGGHDPLGYDSFSPVMQSGTGERFCGLF